MDWTQELVDIFETCRRKYGTHEARYYGPYDILLNHILAQNSDAFTFFVTPQCIPSAVGNLNQAVDFVVCLRDLDGHDANLELKPVLIVEIKDDSWVNSGRLRLRADEQIRLRFNQMLQNCPLPVLYGISFLGTSMHIYSGNVATGDIKLELIDDPDEDRIVPPSYWRGGGT